MTRIKRLTALVGALVLAFYAFVTLPVWLPPLPDPFDEPWGDC